MSKIAVIFDTNSCYADRTQQAFFGRRDTLIKISQRATIYMPQIVIDELVQQKTEGIQENLNILKRNSLLPMLGFDTTALETVNEQEHVRKLQIMEDIPYQVIDIKDPVEAYKKIRKWVIPGNPPFNMRNSNGKNNSDKGIKDALIACTIDDFLKQKTYDVYYLACMDGRLKEYYKNRQEIICLSPDEIAKELSRVFFDDYTVGAIRNELEQPEAILRDNWVNRNTDVVSQFDYEEYSTLVLQDATSKEIIKTSDSLLIEDPSSLQASGSFSSTHNVVTRIHDSLDFYRQEELAAIKDAMMTNNQVYGIGLDEDVKSLALELFSFFIGQLDDKEKERFDVYYGLREIE